jgi:hypothetical protein
LKVRGGLFCAGIGRRLSTMLRFQSMIVENATEPAQAGPGLAGDVTHLRQVTRQQWRWGIAAWLGWTFDGLDMHLYTLVAAPFVAQLLGAASTTDPRVGRYGSIIQGGFMLGWALGGRVLRAHWRPVGPRARAPRCKGIVRAESNTCQAKETTLPFAPWGVG